MKMLLTTHNHSWYHYVPPDRLLLLPGDPVSVKASLSWKV